MNPKAAITEKAYPRTPDDDDRPESQVLAFAEHSIVRSNEEVPGPQHPIK